MVLGCEIHDDEVRLEQVSELRYFGCVLDESGTDDAECHRMAVSGRKVRGAIRSLVKARSLQLECASVLHEGLLELVLLYGSEAMIWREKERSRIRVMLRDNLINFVVVKKMDRVLNARIRELCRVAKGVDESVLCWFGHIERMENGRITKRVYVR